MQNFFVRVPFLDLTFCQNALFFYLYVYEKEPKIRQIVIKVISHTYGNIYAKLANPFTTDHSGWKWTWFKICNRFKIYYYPSPTVINAITYRKCGRHQIFYIFHPPNLPISIQMSTSITTIWFRIWCLWAISKLLWGSFMIWFDSVLYKLNMVTICSNFI